MKNTKIKQAFFLFVVSQVAALSLATSNVHAFGGRRPSAPSNGIGTQAFPARVVSVGTIYDTAFKLPDSRGMNVDMKKVLPVMLATQATEAGDKIRIASLEAPASRYVITGGLTSFVAEVNGFGITFGYKPSNGGDVGNGQLTGGEGKVDVRIGELEMDFHIVDTQSNQIVVAKFASANDLGVSLHAQVDFSQYQTALDFTRDSPIGKVIRRAMTKVIQKMTEDPKTNFYMDWSSKLAGVNLDLKRVFFNAGMVDSIQDGNVFTVYDGNVRLGEIKVEKADRASSTAYFVNDKDDKLLKSARAGDDVRVYFKEAP